MLTLPCRLHQHRRWPSFSPNSVTNLIPSACAVPPLNFLLLRSDNPPIHHPPPHTHTHALISRAGGLGWLPVATLSFCSTPKRCPLMWQTFPSGSSSNPPVALVTCPRSGRASGPTKLWVGIHTRAHTTHEKKQKQKKKKTPKQIPSRIRPRAGSVPNQHRLGLSVSADILRAGACEDARTVVIMSNAERKRGEKKR